MPEKQTNATHLLSFSTDTLHAVLYIVCNSSAASDPSLLCDKRVVDVCYHLTIHQVMKERQTGVKCLNKYVDMWELICKTFLIQLAALLKKHIISFSNKMWCRGNFTTILTWWTVANTYIHNVCTDLESFITNLRSKVKDVGRGWIWTVIVALWTVAFM